MSTLSKRLVNAELDNLIQITSDSKIKNALRYLKLSIESGRLDSNGNPDPIPDPVPTPTWYRHYTYENGTVGSRVAVSYGGDAWLQDSIAEYSSDIAFAGTKSAKHTIATSDAGGGFGKWGGIERIEPKLKKNDELWFQTKLFFPVGFDFNAGGSLKMIRFRIYEGNGTAIAFNDLYMNSGTADPAEFSLRWEINNGHPTQAARREFNSQVDRPDLNNTETVVRGVWKKIEYYMKFHETAGVTRVWFDDQLRFEDTSTRTLVSSTDECGSIYLWTYWNSGIPQTQSAYEDETIIAVSSNPPTNLDASGNRFIG